MFNNDKAYFTWNLAAEENAAPFYSEASEHFHWSKVGPFEFYSVLYSIGTVHIGSAQTNKAEILPDRKINKDNLL